MGYRLGIKTQSDYFDGGKLYGYYCFMEEEELESYRYLASLNKWKQEPFFEDCCDNEITLTEEEFNTFTDLYLKDFLDCWKDCRDGEYYQGIAEDMNKAKTIKGDKVLSWG